MFSQGHFHIFPIISPYFLRVSTFLASFMGISLSPWQDQGFARMERSRSSLPRRWRSIGTSIYLVKVYSLSWIMSISLSSLNQRTQKSMIFNSYVGMGQYLLIPFLVGWTSVYQLFWGSLGTRVLTHPHVSHCQRVQGMLNCHVTMFDYRGCSPQALQGGGVVPDGGLGHLASAILMVNPPGIGSGIGV